MTIALRGQYHHWTPAVAQQYRGAEGEALVP